MLIGVCLIVFSGRTSASSANRDAPSQAAKSIQPAQATCCPVKSATSEPGAASQAEAWGPLSVTFWQRLFDTSDFPPRWRCGTWASGHGWLHIASDLLIWSAYLAIPILLLFFFVSRRNDIPFQGV